MELSTAVTTLVLASALVKDIVHVLSSFPTHSVLVRLIVLTKVCRLIHTLVLFMHVHVP